MEGYSAERNSSLFDVKDLYSPHPVFFARTIPSLVEGLGLLLD
jgi:hypothetical protein